MLVPGIASGRSRSQSVNVANARPILGQYHMASLIRSLLSSPAPAFKRNLEVIGAAAVVIGPGEAIFSGGYHSTNVVQVVEWSLSEVQG